MFDKIYFSKVVPFMR